jgi:hypothetical protein
VAHRRDASTGRLTHDLATLDPGDGPRPPQRRKVAARQLDAIRGKITDLEALGREGSGAGAAPRRKAGRRRLSAEGRAAISKAAKKRWAKYRAEQRSKRR